MRHIVWVQIYEWTKTGSAAPNITNERKRKRTKEKWPNKLRRFINRRLVIQLSVYGAMRCEWIYLYRRYCALLIQFIHTLCAPIHHPRSICIWLSFVQNKMTKLIVIRIVILSHIHFDARTWIWCVANKWNWIETKFGENENAFLSWWFAERKKNP